MKPRFLSLFSGIALHDLGLVRAGWEVAAQCETDPWCRAVCEKNFPGVPRWEDVRDVDEESVRSIGRVELVTGGFPCPDISCAGRGVGLLRGERSSLWLEMLRVIRLARPAFVLAENVPALRSRGIDSVLHGLEEEGYAAWPVVVGAWALGAPQRRERAWIVGVAHGDCGALRLEPGRRDGEGGSAEPPEPGGGGEGMERAEGFGEGEQGVKADALAARREARLEPRHGGGGRAGMAGGKDGGRAHEGQCGREPEEPESECVGKERWVGVAGADSKGLAEHGSERGNPRSQFPAAVGGGGARMADGAGGGWEEGIGEQLSEGRDEPNAPWGGSWPGWCSARGEEQHSWEPSRTVAFPQRFVGGELAGGAAGVDGAAGRGGKRALRIEVARKREARYEKWCNGQRLKALGNANPPGVPELIGGWFLNILEAEAVSRR